MKPGIEKCRQISELAQLKRALATVHEKNRIETIQRKIVILRQILSDSEAVFNAFNETNRTRNRVDPLEVMAEMDAVPKITFRRGFFWNR